MKYKDLNLKKVRDDNGLDFAHFTYQPGMCSCCYGPKDLPARYWKNHKVAQDGEEYTYILYKNANNGSGPVKRNEECKPYECVSWRFPEEKLERVCRSLQEMYGPEWGVFVPHSHTHCIIITKKNAYPKWCGDDSESIEKYGYFNEYCRDKNYHLVKMIDLNEEGC